MITDIQLHVHELSKKKHIEIAILHSSHLRFPCMSTLINLQF